MKKRKCAGLIGIAFVLAAVFAACDNPAGGGTGGGGDKELTQTDLQKYQKAGENVSTKTWSTDYDCSNFSTQFYQNCYKAGLPCRVRLGTATNPGTNTQENHAWNSVKINGQWVDWEPQLKTRVDRGTYTQTATSDPELGAFTLEDVTRMMYELVGRKVPSSVIDNYEIDDHLFENSPFNSYFGGINLSDNSAYAAFVAQIRTAAPNNGDGVFAISQDLLHIVFAYKLNNKYYALDSLERNDPAEGRSAAKESDLERVAASTTVIFVKPDISF
jgi:hypothetical protein